jgi:hypothetical protein
MLIPDGISKEKIVAKTTCVFLGSLAVEFQTLSASLPIS